MPKVPETARNLSWRKLIIDGSLEADYGSGYSEGKGTPQHPSHPDLAVSLKLGVDTDILICIRFDSWEDRGTGC